ncbi:decarboxylating 6-phosphogluconate dehydrogenase [Acetobacteraceae bacterium]|nr:decarboxylating 6-phosphogluconate dehydrogenase [Acetobacteraceae bacterium]
MRIGLIGLGRMGSNIAVRLTRHGHEVVVWDCDPQAIAETVDRCEDNLAVAAYSLEDLVRYLGKSAGPKIIWVMIPAGSSTQECLDMLYGLLEKDDIVIDGGNSYFKDDIRRADHFAQKKIHYLDVGTSGGVWGLERGYCLMCGGNKEIFLKVEPIFKALCPGRGSIKPVKHRDDPRHDSRAEEGYLYCGPSGSGHFVKMIHNGIEYGMMQAFAEGFDVLKSRNLERLPEKERYDLNLADIAELWRRGSVVTSWLLDLKAEALANSPDLSEFSGVVADSGEGRWTVEAAIDEDVSAPVMTAALFARFRSRSGNTFGEKSLSAMRFGFGGHKEDSTAPSDIGEINK